MSSEPSTCKVFVLYNTMSELMYSRDRNLLMFWVPLFPCVCVPNRSLTISNPKKAYGRHKMPE